MEMIEFIKGKRNKSHKLLFLLMGLFVLVFLFFFIITTYFINQNDLILKHDLTCNFREKVLVSSFIAKLNGELVTNDYVDTNQVGKQTLTISYRNKYGLTVRKKIEIEVKDVTPPTVVVSNPYTAEVGSITNLLDTIFCADDYDDNVSCNIDGEYDLTQVGKYPLKLIAKDGSGNLTEKNFTLNMIDKQKSTPTPPSQDYTKFQDIYQKYKNEHTKIGLDISKWQQTVDFAKIKENGVEFVMLKLGGQSQIGGEITVDPKFYENIEQALANNIPVGVYFYSYARTTTEAKKQAEWVDRKLKKYDIILPVAFDWENWAKYSSFHMSFNTLNKVATSFLDQIAKYGYEGILYSSKYYLETIWYPENYTSWLAYYTNHNDYKGEYVMWQLCNDGKIEGIDGYVDIDIWYQK